MATPKLTAFNNQSQNDLYVTDRLNIAKWVFMDWHN